MLEIYKNTQTFICKSTAIQAKYVNSTNTNSEYLCLFVLHIKQKYLYLRGESTNRLSFFMESRLKYPGTGTTITVRMEELDNRHVYYREVRNEKGDISLTRYDCRTMPIHRPYGDMVFIGDRDDNLRIKPYFYINAVRANEPLASRLHKARAIQEYYTYCDIFGANPEHLRLPEYYALKKFLRRTEIEPINGSQIRVISTETVKQKISIIRTYLEQSRLDFTAFAMGANERSRNEIRGPHRVGLVGRRGRRGDPDLRSDPSRKMRPKEHFRYDVAGRIAKAMLTAGDKMLLLIFLICLHTGMRRGEVLGLTINDLRSSYIEEVDRETGEYRRVHIWYLLIRNRASDNDDQRSKTLMRPRTEAEEQSSDFANSYFESEIPQWLWQRIQEFYIESRDAAVVGERRAKAIREATRATAGAGSDPRQPNFYIFYNEYRGEVRPLSGATMNNRLRKYYDAEGLILRNVSHAMRHSFTMQIAHYSPNKVGQKFVQAALHHACIQSSDAYFNLTIEERHAYHERISQEIAQYLDIE